MHSSGHGTPEENIGSLGARIGVLAILICGVVFLIGLLINTKDPEYPDNPSSSVAVGEIEDLPDSPTMVENEV